MDRNIYDPAAEAEWERMVKIRLGLFLPGLVFLIYQTGFSALLFTIVFLPYVFIFGGALAVDAYCKDPRESAETRQKRTLWVTGITVLGGVLAHAHNRNHAQSQPVYEIPDPPANWKSTWADGTPRQDG